MVRPRVVIYAEASLDGRITVAPDALLLFGDERWPSPGEPNPSLKRVLETHSPQAMLEGSGSFVLPDAVSTPLPAADLPAAELYTDYVPEDVARRAAFKGWFVVADARGRVRWTYTGEPGREAPGSEGWHLLVLTSQSTPAEYLAYLRREHVPYLIAGSGRVDLETALRKLLARLGVECVLCTSPGKLGGALLRAGLVDEIDILWLPIVVGGKNTPSLFECPDLKTGEWPTKLSLISSGTLPDGHVWLRYRVDGGNTGEHVLLR